jgi:tRNA A-37 threonylcarbamoyl transferase component Bud32
LVKIDLHYRWKQGVRRELPDYLRDFPELNEAEEFRADLVEYAERLGKQHGDEKSTLREGRRATGDNEIPAAIGKYVVVSQLDRGGQSSVYRGVHPLLGKDVVIKLGHDVLPPDLADRDQLRAEGRILAELDHPNLARVYDFDFHKDRPYLVMEYVRGRTLDQFALQERPKPRHIAKLVAKIASALAVPHRRGIIHQDLKPRNILIDEAGEPRIIDFGLARQKHAWADDPARPGTISGTVHYMAPEQARGQTDRVNQHSDIFALGALLYYLLAGKAPFAAPTFDEALERAQRCDFDRAPLHSRAIPRSLARICLRAMNEDPARRYATAESMAADLEAFARRPLVWTGALAGAIGAAVIALGIANGWFLPKTGQAAAAVALGVKDPCLDVKVHRRGRWFSDLANLVPLQTKEELKIRVAVPVPRFLALFAVNEQGEMTLLTASDKPVAELVYPKKGSIKVAGPPGTECLLVCGDSKQPVDAEHVKELWRQGDKWPALPKESALRLNHDRVAPITPTKNFEPGAPHADPEEDVTRRLDALRSRLIESYDYVEGVAYLHAEPG